MATQDLKTHSDLGEVTPAATDAIGLWRGTAGAQTLGWAELGDLPMYPDRFTEVSGQLTSYDLANGAATLDISKPRIQISGTAGASFDYTLPDGATDRQEIIIEVFPGASTTFGAFAVVVKDEASATVTGLHRGLSYEMRWNATSTTWQRRRVTPMTLPFKTGSGSPIGSVTPDFVPQGYRDTTNDFKYEAKGELNTDWFLVGGGSSGDAAPTLVEFSTSAALTAAQRSANNVQVYAGANSIDFDVPVSVVGAWIIRAYDKDDDTPRSGCTVSVAGNVGEVNDSAGGSREIAPGGTAIVTSNGAATPSVKVTGNIFEPDLSRGATTLSSAALIAADHQRSITITGNQTISVAVASIPAGFTAVYWASGADRTIDGLDADHVIPNGAGVTVHKNAAGALVCSGPRTTTPHATVLDAA